MKLKVLSVLFCVMVFLVACATIKPAVRKKPPSGQGWQIYQQGYNYQTSSFAKKSSATSSYNVVLEGSPKQSREKEKADRKRNVKDIKF